MPCLIFFLLQIIIIIFFLSFFFSGSSLGGRVGNVLTMKANVLNVLFYVLISQICNNLLHQVHVFT